MDVRVKKSGRGRPRTRPKKLAGDKSYSGPRIRSYLIHRGIQPVIPRKSNEVGPKFYFDRRAYRKRNVVERSVGWLKENRRIGTRYEKLAVNFLAMLKFAIMQYYFRKIDLSDRT